MKIQTKTIWWKPATGACPECGSTRLRGLPFVLARPFGKYHMARRHGWT